MKNLINGTNLPNSNDGLKESQGRIDFEKFTYYLIDKCKVTDPDVLLFYGVIKGDAEIVKISIDKGANVNVTDTQLIKRYQKECENFLKR